MKKLALTVLSIFCLYSCGKIEQNPTDIEPNLEHNINSYQNSNLISDTTTTNENLIADDSEKTLSKERTDNSSLEVDEFYHTNNKKEVFNFNNMYVKPVNSKIKLIKTATVVSFQGENRSTLILNFSMHSKDNLRGVYLMHSYIGEVNGSENFKYEKVDGDNDDEYFTFAFEGSSKLTITNLTNKDIFIFENTVNN
jgi:hypothetical protein